MRLLSYFDTTVRHGIMNILVLLIFKASFDIFPLKQIKKLFKKKKKWNLI